MATPDPVTITVLGNPASKGRPRFTRQGVAYTPTETRRNAETLAWAAREAMSTQAGNVMFDTPVEMIVLAEFQVPKSWSNKKKNAAITGELRHGSRPDIDNVVKQATDALKGVVYRDDSLVWRLAAIKRYSNQPKLVVTVSAV
jgi:Holliday junction resolvase RusA-like endonuclease